ncbi:MAG: hypothetical protein WD875_02205, partial [Pirellulales bacterium]
PSPPTTTNTITWGVNGYDRDHLIERGFVIAKRRQLGVAGVVLQLHDRHRRNNGDNDDDQQHFDQRETAATERTNARRTWRNFASIVDADMHEVQGVARGAAAAAD